MVYALAIRALVGVNIKFHFLAELSADEPAHAVGFPSRSLHQFGQGGSLGLLVSNFGLMKLK